jgi:hypothetical protein
MPLLQERFLAWTEKVEFWHVDDGPELGPGCAWPTATRFAPAYYNRLTLKGGRNGRRITAPAA